MDNKEVILGCMCSIFVNFTLTSWLLDSLLLKGLVQGHQVPLKHWVNMTVSLHFSMTVTVSGASKFLSNTQLINNPSISKSWDTALWLMPYRFIITWKHIICGNCWIGNLGWIELYKSLESCLTISFCIEKANPNHCFIHHW